MTIQQNISTSSPKYNVSLLPCATYNRSDLEQNMWAVLLRSGILASSSSQDKITSALSLSRGAQVLVKPNLLRADALTCTHPEVVRALCVCLLDSGVKVKVMDSPGFGLVKSVAKKVGLTQALSSLGLKVEEFNKFQNITLPNTLGSWKVGLDALEAQIIISVPRLKVHSQLRLTLGVKNLFGCVVGLSKAMAHTRQGSCLDNFCHSILALYKTLPTSFCVIDAITAMHKRGPSGGEAFNIACLGASTNAMALDVAIYNMLKVNPAHIPLWNVAQKLNLLESFDENIYYTDKQATQFDCENFILPKDLMDISFEPQRLLRSLIKRLWSRLF